MEKKLRIGVFGGARGHAMMEVLFEHPHAELAAVCDKYQPLLDQVAEEAKARISLLRFTTTLRIFSPVTWMR